MNVAFLSPHLDDVALSSTSAVREHVLAGDRVEVITVFAGPPPADLPLQALHRDLVKREPTVADLEAMWRVRLDEDRAAMAVLGVAHRHLAFAEAAFRPEVTSWRHIWHGDVDASAVRDALLADWRRDRPLVYAPLAVGGHVDHAICFAAARALADAGADVWFYEDFPYAVRGDALEQRLAEVGPMTSRTIAPHLAEWIAATRCYTSQITGMFGSIEQVEPVLSALAPRQRVWR